MHLCSIFFTLHFKEMLRLLGGTKYLYFSYKTTSNTDVASAAPTQWISYDNVKRSDSPCSHKECYTAYQVGEFQMARLGYIMLC